MEDDDGDEIKIVPNTLENLTCDRRIHLRGRELREFADDEAKVEGQRHGHRIDLLRPGVGGEPDPQVQQMSAIG